MSDVIRIAGQAQTFTYSIRDAQNNLLIPAANPTQSLHATSADAATGANPLSGPTQLTGSAGVYTCTYPSALGAGTYYVRTVSSILTDVDDRLILQAASGTLGSSLASLSDFKSALNWAGDASNDTELQSFLDAATRVVEYITGPVLSRTVTEQRNGGQPSLTLRSTPVIGITSVTEYSSATATVLTQAANPAAATVSSYTFDASSGTLTRRTSGGAARDFAAGDRNIVIAYTAGRGAVPENVKRAALHQAAHMYQATQLGGGQRRAPGQPLAAVGSAATGYGYGVPNAVREYLEADQRLPGIA